MERIRTKEFDQAGDSDVHSIVADSFDKTATKYPDKKRVPGLRNKTNHAAGKLQQTTE